jgi:hypothetical protein
MENTHGNRDATIAVSLDHDRRLSPFIIRFLQLRSLSLEPSRKVATSDTPSRSGSFYGYDKRF